MKKLIFTVLTMLTAICTHAITVNELFAKYGNLSDSQHVIVKGQELKSLIDSCETEQEKEIFKKIKKIELAAFGFDDEVYEKLADDIRDLKSYELATSVTHNNNTDDNDSVMSKSMFKTFVNNIMNPSVKINIYSKKSNDDNLKDPLYVVNYFGCIFIVYFEGTLKPEEPDAIMDFSYDYHTEDSVTSSSSFENIAIAFDGKINETLTSIEDAENYMTRNNLHPNIHHIYTDKDKISKEFPGVDADMLINYISSENKTAEKQDDKSCGE